MVYFKLFGYMLGGFLGITLLTIFVFMEVNLILNMKDSLKKRKMKEIIIPDVDTEIVIEEPKAKTKKGE